jgi:glycosyltransferase involved in cell wall biosynthesis
MPPASQLPPRSAPRVFGALVGDIAHQAGARTKYGLFFDALAQRFPVAGVYDATLRGIPRALNAARVFHPSPSRWKERFYQNVPAFVARSQEAVTHWNAHRAKADVIVQVGVLFDARWPGSPWPSVIYTDYTARLAAQNRWQGRSPFTPAQREQWIELERQAFVHATHICTRGQFVWDSVVNDYGLPPEKVTAIGGGVNFEPLPDISRDARAGRDAPSVLFIGKELYRKGGDILLRAFARAREHCPSAKLRMVTADPLPADVPHIGVEVIAPTWDRTVIADLYRDADIFVLPSRLETWGDVLLEAMAYGLPCVGVAGQAMEEIIEHAHTGLVTAADDAEALAHALTALLTDASRREQLGRAARQKVERQYTWARIVERIAPMIEMAAQNKDPEPG